MEKTIIDQNSKNSKPNGKKPILQSPIRTPTSRSLRKSAYKPRIVMTTNPEAFVLNVLDWFSPLKVSTMNYQ